PAARSFHSRARTRTSRSREATACSAWRARSRPWSPPTRESASRPLFSARRPPPYRSCGAWAPGESRAPERCSSCPRSSRPRPPPRRSSSRRGSPAPPSWSAARIRDAPEGEDLRMSFLRSIEQRVEGLIEGAFGRAFRTHVQPVELARKLTKEMDDHRTVSVSKVYVPNESASPVELGVEEPKATITVGDRTHEVDSRRVVIGRSRECDIQISDPNASRRHAEIRRDGDTFSVVDLGSTNGTDVNGRRTQ